MKNVMKYLLPFWRGLIGSTILITAATVCDLLLPAIMSDILNNGVYGQNFPYIVKCCGLMLLVALVSLGGTLWGSKISNEVVAGFCAALRNAIFKKVNRMSFEEFGKLGTAALVTRATHDVQTLSWIASQLAGTLITIPVLFFGGFFLTMQKDMALAFVLLAFMPVIFVVVIFIGKWILPLWDESEVYMDKQAQILRQRIRGIRVIRAFNAEHLEHQKTKDATETMAEYIIKSNVSMGLITPLATFLLNAATVLLVYLGAVRMENSTGLSGGDMLAIVQYVSLISSGVIMGAFSIIMVPHAKIAAKRINQVLYTEGMDISAGKEDLEITGRIDFQNVSFSYDGASRCALEDVSLSIEKGEKVAIIGGTGSGKSTLLSLLLGFRKPTQGEILLDGRPLQDISIQKVRSNISCALQNASLMTGTVEENVKMGKLDATEDEVWQALTLAQASDFVKEYEDGIRHSITQSGKNLSGGQKQRICIARALVKKAPVYIFDDSFSALDFLTEANLRAALSDVLKESTQITITQRVTSAMHADKIFVMDNGRLCGTGSHQELLKSCQVYREIYASQTGGEV